MEMSRTGFVLNKLSNFFGMMDAAIIENKDTVRPRIGISEGNLNSRLAVKTQGILN